MVNEDGLVVVIQPRLPSEFQADEMDDLVSSLSAAVPSDVSIYEQEPSLLPGISFWQQIYIFLAGGAGAGFAGKVGSRVADRISDEMIDKVVDVGVGWASAGSPRSRIL